MVHKIAIDCSWYKTGKAVGYNSYIKSLLDGLISLGVPNGRTYIIFFPYSEFDFFKNYETENISLQPINTESYLNRFIWLLILSPIYYRKFSGILFTAGFCGIFCRSKKILVLHDLNYIYYPENFTFIQLWFRRVFVYLSLYFADRIICISASVKRSCFHVFQNKCIVIYNSFSRTSSNLDSSINRGLFDSMKAHSDAIKIVIPSSLAVHKNLKNAYYAAASLSRNDSKFIFFIIGNWSSLPSDWPVVDNIIPLGFIPDSDKDFLFRFCNIILVPSIFEGFGLPYLEAMIHKKILVACDIEICRELAGFFPVYINEPFDENSILIALHQAVDIFCSNSIRSTPDLNEFTDVRMAYKYFDEINKVLEHD